jgi:hypothetical protein
MEDMENYLRDISLNASFEMGLRKIAAHLLKGWQAGIIPSQKKLQALRKALADIPRTCGRLQENRSCVWLKKHAEEVGLTPPRPGERAFCTRRNEGKVTNFYSECEGYVKPKI